MSKKGARKRGSKEGHGKGAQTEEITELVQRGNRNEGGEGRPHILWVGRKDAGVGVTQM